MTVETVRKPDDVTFADLIAALKSANDQLWHTVNECSQLRAELTEAKEALRPFAALNEWGTNKYSKFDPKDYARARAILTKLEGE